jgi:hypothetical protein
MKRILEEHLAFPFIMIDLNLLITLIQKNSIFFFSKKTKRQKNKNKNWGDYGHPLAPWG